MTPARRVCAGFGAAVFALASSACGGGTPSAPSQPLEVTSLDPPLTLSSERHFLQVSAIDLTEDFRPWCQPIGVPRAGKFLTTFIWFERDGEDYVGRSRAPYRSTLEIRVRLTGWSLGVARLRGTVTGGAHDEYDRALGLRDLAFEIPPGESAAFTGTATQQGPSVSGPPPALSGTVEGAIFFSDSTAASSRCPTASFVLQVMPPGGPHDDPTVPPLAPVLRWR